MKDLVQIIRDNPGCYAVVDNDCWYLYKSEPPDDFGPDDDGTACDAWYEANELASDSDVKSLGSGYGSGNAYGGDILQALAAIVGIKVTSV